MMNDLKKYLWNNDKQSAISLTFDDGMKSHLDLAIPILENFGLAGTFYPIANGDWMASLDRFRPVFENGHEIGNHSIHHWCSCASSIDLDNIGLEYRTFDELEFELQAADRRFRTVFPEINQWSFCYPCYNTFVGRGRERRSYVPVVASHFFAARAGCEMSVAINSPYHADLHCLNSWKCEHRSADDLIGLVERTNDLGGWSIFTFHGIGEGHLPVERYDFEKLCEYLDEARDHLWVAPLIDVAKDLYNSQIINESE